MSVRMTIGGRITRKARSISAALSSNWKSKSRSPISRRRLFAIAAEAAVRRSWRRVCRRWDTRMCVRWPADFAPGKKRGCRARATSLPSYRLVVPEPALPHVMRGGPHNEHPAALNGERLDHLRAAQAFHENGDGTEKFVVKREPFQRGLDAGRHDID